MDDQKQYQYCTIFYNMLRQIESLTSSGIVIEFTNDQQYLDHYYKLRRNSYETDRQMKGPINRGSLDHFDKTTALEIHMRSDICTQSPSFDHVCIIMIYADINHHYGYYYIHHSTHYKQFS
ncbi:MAG: hypothetical protein MK137_03330 [Rickettsiales bacterium]|nr:hypothetical protein [Rickettsiales bacterium]